MKCNGKCYCGNICALNHETIAQRCDCNNNHKSCQEKCHKHPNNKCTWIAQHRGSHDCFECAKSDINENKVR